MEEHIADPEVIRAIRRLKELHWDCHAKQIDGKWVVSCQKWAFGFNVFDWTLRGAWLAAVDQAEKYGRPDRA